MWIRSGPLYCIFWVLPDVFWHIAVIIYPADEEETDLMSVLRVTRYTHVPVRAFNMAKTSTYI